MATPRKYLPLNTASSPTSFFDEQTSAYSSARSTTPGIPRVTQVYFQVKQVQSRYQKHVSRFQYILHCCVVLALFISFVQGIRTLGMGLYQMVVLSHHQSAMADSFAHTQKENTSLREQIHAFSSNEGIEELARNNLQMIGEDEVLVQLQKASSSSN
ncbi:MAG: septum formation initiator family protein [Cyanobacteria bacterium]|nr:septum formation initiator family protein [Cyanobacteriota bacterium]